MSSTRHASEGSRFRQERYASSQEYERGLMANLVAKRCSVLERAEDRDLIWFLQLISHRPGGVKKLAADLIRLHPERVATKSMRKYGMKADRIYSAAEVKTVRFEIVGGEYPLKGEIPDDDLNVSKLFASEEKLRAERASQELESRLHPSSYPAAHFVSHCLEAAQAGLEKRILALCLDPAIPVADGAPWYFPTLVSTLREFEAEWIAEHKLAAVTAVNAKTAEALDYTLATRRLVLIDGRARIGKTTGTKAWCETHPGQARYVDCPPSNDDFSFFHDIAVSLGVSINLKSKAQELRSRIEDTLRYGDLALVIDQAHCAWPQSHYRNTTPARINWVMAQADRGVPIALVTTPQFFRSQQAIEKATCWTSEQFVGRIGHYEKLPESFADEDLSAVASALLPEADRDSIKLLVAYAKGSQGFLGAMSAIVDRVRFDCRKNGRQKVGFQDLKRVIAAHVIPSDTALATAIKGAPKSKSRRAANVFAEPGQRDLQPLAPPLQSDRSIRPAADRMSPKTELSHA